MRLHTLKDECLMYENKGNSLGYFEIMDLIFLDIQKYVFICYAPET